MCKRRIVALAPFTPEQQAQLREAAGAAFEVCFLQETLDVQQQKAALKNAEIVLGQPEIEAVIDSATLKWVQMTWSGTDKYAAVPFPSNIILTNMRGAFGDAISEYILAAILAWYHHFPGYFRNQQLRQWQPLGKELTLSGKTALILGAGDIGTKTAEKLSALGVQCIGVRRNLNDKPACFASLYSLEQAPLAKADLCICCLPGTTGTTGFFNTSRIAQLKTNAILVNVGRGNFIDTHALVQALDQRRLAGAILDVVNPEPLPSDHPLWHMENVILTPHIAGKSFGHSEVTEQRITKQCCENLLRYQRGLPLQNIIAL